MRSMSRLFILCCIASTISLGACSNNDEERLQQCRFDCSQAHSSCFNNCNTASDPGLCRTGCSNEELKCKQVCDARFPD